MIKIERAILHILDQHLGAAIYSSEPIDMQEDVEKYLARHLERALKDPVTISDHINPNSDVANKIKQIKDGLVSFEDYSKHLGSNIFEQLLQTDNMTSIDLVLCTFDQDGEPYIGILEIPNQIGYTHQVTQNGNVVRNDITKHYAILPTTAQKVVAFAAINTETLYCKYADQRRFLDGKDVFILPQILGCSNSVSQKAAITEVKNILFEVSEKHGKNSSATLSRAKAFLLENSETSNHLDTVELSHVAFPESDEVAEEFIHHVIEREIPKCIPIERSYAIREGRKHRIRTDTGIEITIPSDLFNNPEYVEFRSSPNGMISISIRNVGRILNR